MNRRWSVDQRVTIPVITALGLALALCTMRFPSRKVEAAGTGSTALITVQGSGTGTDFGDYVSSSDGLNTSYHAFVEVPPGLARLTVDIFDADIGLGGTAEATAGRDRDRGGFDSSARYTIFNPSGQQRTTQFTTGDATTPAGSDNAWLTLFDSTGDTVRDNFAAAAYTNNNGLMNWATNWLETNDDNNAGAGLILITGGQLRIRDDGDGSPSTIQREANLTGFVTPTFTFDVSTQNVEAGDTMRVEVSGNGGGSWSTLETFTGTVAAASRSYDISAFAASNTRVRFISVGTGYTGTDSFFVDNVQIKSSTIQAGHWELRVDMSSAITAGDDINALGFRAHDGTPGAGGTELNMYADSLYPIGVNPPASGTGTRSNTVHPYITSGCTCSKNDFDFDSNSGTTGSVALTSRTGSFTQNYNSATLSANNVWRRDSFTGWTSDFLADDYGVWTATSIINSYVVSGTPNGNLADFYFANFQAAANPPSANPAANTFRIYLPSDAGAAPVKPYIDQRVVGPTDLIPVGQSTGMIMWMRVVNPTAYAITFSTPNNLVTANIPGSGTVYGGNAAVSQGSIVSQPAVNGTGNITWNPGTLAAGATAFLTYYVKVTFNSAGQRLPVTATPASGNGTRAQFVDETGNTTQARATYQFGPLCELAVTQGLLTPSSSGGACTGMSPATLPDGVFDTPYDQTMSPTPLVLTSGSLPPGLSLSAGHLIGTPTAFGTFTFSIGGANPGLICAGIRTYTIKIRVTPTAANGTISGHVANGNGAPVEGTIVRLEGAQSRKTITDANGNYHFDNVETDGFYTVTPSRTNYYFNPFNRSFSLLGNKTEAVFAATSTGDNANPLDTPEYFVRQQYVDVLGREPDESGFNYWSDQILACDADADCVRRRRIDVAAAFFIEQEFRRTGLFIYDVYASALGRRPAFSEYAADRTQVNAGANLDERTRAFVADLVQRAEFVTQYQPADKAESFIEALIQNVQAAGFDLSSERANLIDIYNSGHSMVESRAAAVGAIVDHEAFKESQHNAAFVLTEYFGYLRRNPEPGGYNFWLKVIDNGDLGNYRAMVCAFITSREYQQRFSSVVSRTNSECGQ